MTPEELRRLTIFNTVENSPGINQRKLSLDHTLDQYYPRLYNKKKGKISIRNLLTHSSGFKDYIEFYKINGSMKRVDMIDEILSLDLEYEPGEKFVYNRVRR